MTQWGELPPTVKWLVGIGAAIITLSAAWDRVDKFFETRSLNKARHQMVDRDVPKVQSLEEAVQELKTATRGVQTWATDVTIQHLAACDRGDQAEKLCAGIYERAGLNNTYGTKRED